MLILALSPRKQITRYIPFLSKIEVVLTALDSAKPFSMFQLQYNLLDVTMDAQQYYLFSLLSAALLFAESAQICPIFNLTRN